MTNSPTGSVTGVFIAFSITADLPRLRTDEDQGVIVGVPRGAFEDVARDCWKRKARVTISGPVNERKGVITAINVESIREVTA